MATKSKNIKYSYGTKVLAFFLAMALVISAGVLLASDADLMLQYSSDDITSLLTKTEFNYTDNMMFESVVENNLQSLATMVSDDDFKNYIDGIYCTKDDELALAGKYFDSHNYSSDDYSNAYYQYDGSDTESYTNAYGTTEYSYTYTLKISNEPVNYVSSAGRDAFLSDVAKAYDNAVLTAARECANAKVVASNAINSFVNLKFYISNNKTGETYSNVSENEISSLKDGWYIVYKSSSGIMQASDAARVSGKNYYHYYGTGKILDTKFGDKNLDITIALPATENLASGDEYYNLSQNCLSVKNNFAQYMTVGSILLALAFALSIYLVMVSGRTNNSDEPQLSWIDKIPTDIHLALSATASICCVCGAFALVNWLYDSLSGGTYQQTNSYTMILINAALLMVFWAVTVEWATHIARYYKTKRKYFRHSLIGIICIGIYKFLKEICTAVKHAIKFSPKSMKKNVFYIAAGYVILNLICFSILYALQNSGTGIFFMILVIACINIIMLTLIWKYLIALDEIAVAAEKGKNGEPPEKINSEKFPEPMQSIADNLYITQGEMNKAVSEAVKGERMKTELITNVSHDLKTPLTAIITYVDLLKKCNIDDAQAQKFISVLDDKSIRLKHLIDDLVEASKVSSGIVELNLMNVNLNELTIQAIDEVEDNFKANNVEIIYNECTDAPILYADSQKTWRVIDNLLSNARKYSLPGSRVYVEVGKKAKTGYFSIKNVSRQALNIDADELTQRFVRGDASRSNEGSGLGLSIAKDLCSLQGGQLSLEIDGDLFKATIELPLAKELPPAEENSAPESEA